MSELLSADSTIMPTTDYVFSDKDCYASSLRYFLMWRDITNYDPANKKTFAHAAWLLYEFTTINTENPFENAYKFTGTESPDRVALMSMFNALLIFGPQSPGSSYVICRCGRVVHKTKHWTLRNPNAECCVYCRHSYDEDQYSANKLFEMPTSLTTNDVFDVTAEEIPECPKGYNDPSDWGSSLVVQIPSTDSENEPIATPKPYPPIFVPSGGDREAVKNTDRRKRAYKARRKCEQCGGPNLNRKKQKCNDCLGKVSK